MFLMMVVAIIIGTSVQLVAGGKGIKGFDEARDHEDELQRYYNAIASGAKELRIHRPRRFRMNTQRIQKTADRISDIQVRSVNIYILAKSFGSMLFFVVIGLALAMQAYYPNPDPAVITGFVLVLLYMKGPWNTWSATCPSLARRRSPSPVSASCRNASPPPSPIC